MQRDIIVGITSGELLGLNVEKRVQLRFFQQVANPHMRRHTIVQLFHDPDVDCVVLVDVKIVGELGQSGLHVLQEVCEQWGAQVDLARCSPLGRGILDSEVTSAVGKYVLDIVQVFTNFDFSFGVKHQKTTTARQRKRIPVFEGLDGVPVRARVASYVRHRLAVRRDYDRTVFVEERVGARFAWVHHKIHHPGSNAG